MENCVTISTSEDSDSECKNKKQKIYYSKASVYFSSSESEPENVTSSRINEKEPIVCDITNSSDSECKIIKPRTYSCKESHKSEQKNTKIQKINQNEKTPFLNDISDSESCLGKSDPAIYADVILNTVTESNKSTNNPVNCYFNDSDNWSIESSDFNKTHTKRHFESKIVNFCNICEKKGHTSYECTRTGPVCIMCAGEGHQSRKCPQLLCTICYSNNHLTKKCSMKSSGNKIRCQRCDQFGHKENYCPDEWRQYKYTQSNTEPVVKRFSSQSKKSVYCANCTVQGHFTDQCRAQKLYGMFSGPTVMDISTYNAYNNYENMYYLNSFEKGTKKATSFTEPIFEDLNVTTLINERKNSRNKATITDSMSLEEKLANLPPIRNKLLCQLFPEETVGMLTIPVTLRKKLRNKLKNFLKNGYLPGGCDSVNQRMQAWLVDVTRGKETNSTTQLNILSSVSAAVHSISHHVSAEQQSTPIVKPISIAVEKPNYFDKSLSDDILKDIEEDDDFYVNKAQTNGKSELYKPCAMNNMKENGEYESSCNFVLRNEDINNSQNIDFSNNVLNEIENDEFCIDSAMKDKKIQNKSYESILANVVERETWQGTIDDNNFNQPISINNNNKRSQLSKNQKRAKNKRIAKHAANELNRLQKSNNSFDNTEPVSKRTRSNSDVIEIPSVIQSPVVFPNPKRKRRRRRRKWLKGTEHNPICL